MSQVCQALCELEEHMLILQPPVCQSTVPQLIGVQLCLWSDWPYPKMFEIALEIKDVLVEA